MKTTTKNWIIGSLITLAALLVGGILGWVALLNQYLSGEGWFMLPFIAGGALNLLVYSIWFIVLKGMVLEKQAKRRLPLAVIGGITILAAMLVGGYITYMVLRADYIGFALPAIVLAALVNGGAHFTATFIFFPKASN